MKKTYIIDFDGTLVDSMPYYSSAMLSLLDEQKIKYDDGIIEKITPLGFLGTAKYFIELGVPMTIEELATDLGGRLFKVYSEDIPAKRNVLSTLRELQSRGYDLNILSAGPHLTLDACAKRLGMDSIMTNIWSSDDFGTTKTDPDLFRRVAERLGQDISEFVFIDDNIGAIRTAKAAGVTAYGVYDESSRDQQDEIRSLCDRYIYDFSELL